MRFPLIAFAAAALATSAIADEPSPTLSATLREAGTGAIVRLDGLDPLNMPGIAVQRTVSGGKMIYCGSPEYCPGPGVLYQDTFSAGTDVRLYFYHVNASREPLRFSIVLEPVGGPAVVDVQNTIVLGPSRDYYSVGRLSSFIELARPVSREPRRMNLATPTILDADMDSRVCPPGRPEPLVHSLHDFRVVSGTVRVSTVAVRDKDDTLITYSSLSQLPRDRNHTRGTYEGSTIDVVQTDTYSTADGVKHLRLADGKADPGLDGGDVTLNQHDTYLGAYGVVYRIHLKLASPDGRNVALVLNPRAGDLGGAVAVAIPKRGKTAGYAPGLGLGTVSDKDEAVVLGKWNPRETPEVTILWTPPGAASLPVEWLLVPYEG